MAKGTPALDTPLREQLDRLAAFEATDCSGSEPLSGYPRRSAWPRQLRHVFEKGFPRSRTRLDRRRSQELQRRCRADSRVSRRERAELSQRFAIFACSAANGFFEALQLDAPIEGHWLFVGGVPHLYPLARLNDQYPRYAALLVDTNAARLFVFGLNTKETQREVRNAKTRKSSMGGWSQARYQRHVSNIHLHHLKEVIDVLDRVVREDSIGTIVVACDPVTLSTLTEQMPKHLAEKVVDVVHVDIHAPEHQVLTETLDAMRERDASTDAERVARLLDAWRSGGLGVVGPEATLDALAKAQVEELLITATPRLLRRAQNLPGGTARRPTCRSTRRPRRRDRSRADEAGRRPRHTGAVAKRAHPVHRGWRAAGRCRRRRRDSALQDLRRRFRVCKDALPGRCAIGSAHRDPAVLEARTQNERERLVVAADPVFDAVGAEVLVVHRPTGVSQHAATDRGGRRSTIASTSRRGPSARAASSFARSSAPTSPRTCQ
jgi:protein required for attachment to host cells